MIKKKINENNNKEKEQQNKTNLQERSQEAIAPNTIHPVPKEEEEKNEIGYYEYFQDFLEVRLAWTKQNSLRTFFSMAAHSCVAFPMLCSQLIMPFFWPRDERLE